MRWLALISGVALIAVAVVAVTRVEDTREGLIAEVIALFGALAGVSLLIYGLVARRREAPARATIVPARTASPRRRSMSDLRLGGAGLALAILLLVGLAVSGGFTWAALGLALLLPMIGGSVYLCVRYLRANP